MATKNEKQSIDLPETGQGHEDKKTGQLVKDNKVEL